MLTTLASGSGSLSLSFEIWPYHFTIVVYEKFCIETKILIDHHYYG